MQRHSRTGASRQNSPGKALRVHFRFAHGIGFGCPNRASGGTASTKRGLPSGQARSRLPVQPVCRGAGSSRASPKLASKVPGSLSSGKRRTLESWQQGYDKDGIWPFQPVAPRSEGSRPRIGSADALTSLGRRGYAASVSTARLDPRPGYNQSRLAFIEWCLTPDGLRVACRCACGWLTVVRAGDSVHGRVSACPVCAGSIPRSEWLERLRCVAIAPPSRRPRPCRRVHLARLPGHRDHPGA